MHEWILTQYQKTGSQVNFMVITLLRYTANILQDDRVKMQPVPSHVLLQLMNTYRESTQMGNDAPCPWHTSHDADHSLEHGSFLH